MDIWRYTFAHWLLEQANRYHRDLVATMEALARGEKGGRAYAVCDGVFQYAVGSHIVFWRETQTTFDVIRVQPYHRHLEQFCKSFQDWFAEMIP